VFTKGPLRSNPHRVVVPAGEDRGKKRYCLMYFLRPGDDVLVRKAEGSERVPEEEVGQEKSDMVRRKGFTGYEWVQWRLRMQGRLSTAASIEVKG